MKILIQLWKAGRYSMSQKGVSLMQLIITIVLIIVLASLAVLNSGEVADEATIAKEFESMKMVKNAVDNSVMLIELNPDKYVEAEIFGARMGDSRNNYYKKIGLSDVSELSDRTYLIDQTNQHKLSLEKIPEGKIYIVDLENENYYVVGGIQREGGDLVYEYKDILKAYNLLSNKE